MTTPSSFSINYFPNPVIDKFIVIGLAPNASFEAAVFDMSGRIIKSMINVGSEFDVTELAAGSYMIELRGKKNYTDLL